MKDGPLHKYWTRGALAAAVALLLSVSGVSEERGGASQRTVDYSDWQGAADGDGDGLTTGRVGSFTVGKPAAEKFVGGLFEEWRDIIVPEFGAFDRNARQTIRDRLFFDREVSGFNEYLRARREALLLRLNRASSDYLTDALVDSAEGKAAASSSTVRNVDLDYQSGLAGRRWQTGINVLGSWRETMDDALAWQMRAYAAEESAAGGNFGVIYRRRAGEQSLWGLNVFVDYEDHLYGDFWRWSYGGELRGRWGGLYANHYLAISEDRPMEENGKKYMAYTREGADVALDLTVPRYNWLSGGVSYYHWKGKYGQVDDKGLRHHLGFDFSRLFGGGDFWGGLSFEVEYDRPRNGKTDWGGRVAYSYRFGDSSPTGESPAADTFDPRAHFFDRARREYAQRISRAEVGPSGPVGEQVSVYLVGGKGRAVVRYSATEIALSSGGVTAAIYPLLATATVWTAADSALDMGYQNLTSNIGWTVRLEAETTVDVNAGTALSLRQGGISIEQVGGIHLATSPSVAVNFAAGRQRVRMVHPYVQTVTQTQTQTVTQTVTQTRVTFQEGIVSVDVAGTLASHVYELIVHTTKVTAEIVSEEGKIRVPPVEQTVSVAAMVVAGERASYTLSVANGERFSHRYDGRVSYPSGWTVSSEGVVRSPTIMVAVTDITVIARSDSIEFFHDSDRDSEGFITLARPISETWVIRFDTKKPVVSAASSLRVAGDYIGVLQTVVLTGEYGSVTFETPPEGVAVVDSDGIVSLTTSLSGTDRVVTVVARDSLSSVTHILHLRSVAPLTFAPLPTMYIPTFTSDINDSPFRLAVTGGDGESPVTYATDSENYFRLEDEALVAQTLNSPTLDVFVVRATQEGVLGGVATVSVTVWAFDHLAVASPVSVTISGRESGVVDGFRIEPTGGSSLYVYAVLTVTDSLGRTLGVTVDTEGRLSMAVSLSTTTITVDVRVSDAIVSPAGLTMANVYAGTPHQDLTIVLGGVSRLRLSGARSRYYVSSGRLTTDTSNNRQEVSFVPYALATLTATGGSDGAYEWGEETGTNSEGLLELVAGSVNVATVSVVQHFIPPWDPSAGGAPSNLTLGLREWAVTVGGGGDLGATATLSVEFYVPISLQVPDNPVNVMEDFTGTLTVLHIHGGTDSTPQIGYQAVVTSGSYANHFATAFVLGSVNSHAGGRFSVPVYLVVVSAVARDFVAVVSMTVTDGAREEKISVVLTISGQSFSQTKPFPAVALAPDTACSGSSCEVIDDLDSYYTGGTPPYSYSVIFDAAGGNANFGVSGGQLLFTGDARASGEVITATVVAVGSRVTVQSPITVFFSTAPSFFPTHVARSVEAGYTGAVYLPMVEDGTGPFVYSVVAPTFISGGGRTVSVSGGGPVTLLSALQATEDVWVTVVARDTRGPFAGRLATLRLNLAGDTASVSFPTVWYPSLRVGEGGLAVASLASSIPAMTASVVGSLFRYESTSDTGGFLYAGVSDMAGTRVATLAVSSQDLGWNTLTVRHTVTWVAFRPAAVMVGGREDVGGTEVEHADAWGLNADGSWARLCDDCLGTLSDVAYHQFFSYQDSLWVVSGGKLFRSGDGGRSWEESTAFTSIPDGSLVPYRGTLWGVGGLGGNIVSYATVGGQFVTTGVTGLVGGENSQLLQPFGGSLFAFGGDSYDGGRGVWASHNGLAWVQLTTQANFGKAVSWQADVVVHKGSMFLYEGVNDDIWASTDGVDWQSKSTLPMRRGHQIFSYAGSLWVVGGNTSVTVAEVWRSADGSSWVRAGDATFGARVGHRIVSLQDETEGPPPAGIATGGGFVGIYAVSLGTGAPAPGVLATLSTLTYSGGVGAVVVSLNSDSPLLRIVGATEGTVPVVLTAESATVGRLMATVILKDSTPNVVEVALTVHVYEPVAFVPSRVTQSVAAGFVGGVFVPMASEGSGAFLYSVVSPGASSGGRMITAAVAGATVSLGTTLGVGETVTLSVVAREGPASGFNADDSAVLTLVLVGAEPSASFSDVWFSRLRTGDGDVAVARLAVRSMPGVTVGVSDPLFSYVPDGEDADGGGVLRIGTSSSAGVRAVTLLVSSRLGGGLPTLTVAHTVEFVAPRTGGERRVSRLVMIDGESQVGSGEGISDAWFSEDGETWTQGCVDNCFWKAPQRESTSVDSPQALYNLVYQDGTLWALGHYAFRSRDGGLSWPRVKDLPATGGAKVFGDGGLVSHGGTLWGLDARTGPSTSGYVEYFVWDGNNLTGGSVQVNLPGGGGFLDNRFGHAAVSFNGRLWFAGGLDTNFSSHGHVWSSADGRTWREVVATAAFGSRAYLDMAVHNGSMYVYGGARYSGGAFQGFADAFVWRSSDGANWAVAGTMAATLRAAKLVSYGGSLLIVGGTGSSGNTDLRGQSVEVWRSADGANWELATADAGFSGRAWHQVVSVGVDVDGFLPPRTMVSLDGPSSRFVNVGAETAPMAVATGVIFGGAGAYDVSLVSESDLPMLDMAGSDLAVVRLTGFGAAGSRLTVTVRVNDGTPSGTMTDWVLTVGFVDVSFSVFYRQFRTGDGGRVVASLRVGGVPGATVRVLADSIFEFLPRGTDGGGVLSVGVTSSVGARAVALAVSSRSVADFPTFRFVHTVRWEAPQDGAQVTMMFMMGARDLWGTADGVSWELLCEDCWGGNTQDEPLFGFHRGSLWMLGSGNDDGAYRSGDGGRTWSRLGMVAGHPDDAARLVSHGGSLWTIGGGNGDDSVAFYVEDDNRLSVVAGTGGGTTSFERRVGHSAASFGASLYVLAGDDGSGVLRNNVWASADGKAWMRVAAESFLYRRSYGGLAVHNGTLFSFGGVGSSGDVQSSTDGAAWTKVGDVPDGGRQRHQMASFGGSLWVIGGATNRDIWRSADGVSWVLDRAEAPFGLVGDHRVVVGTGAADDWVLPQEAGISVGDDAPSVFTVQTGTTAPVTLANLFLWGGRGGYSGRVATGGDGFAVTIDGRVAAVVVTSVPAAATVATVTLVFGDGTPDGRYEHVVTVHFVAASGGTGDFPIDRGEGEALRMPPLVAFLSGVRGRGGFASGQLVAAVAGAYRDSLETGKD